MSLVIAAIGAKALYLLYAWLASAIVANYVSERKGYGPKLGLALGLLLSVIGAIITLVMPARQDSRWKLQGPFGGAAGRPLPRPAPSATRRSPEMFVIAAENLPSGLYTPLVVLLVAYAGLTLLA